jgi:hypothetical protein
MSRIPNQTLRRTLGFFRQGIPVLFIKNDAMFRSLNLPDDYSKLLDEDGSAIPGLAFGDDEVAAFERFATILHELRHFHDALLCRPLFDKFLLQHKITWYTLQLINRLARYRHLPRQIADPLWDRDPGLATLKRLLLDADADLYDRYPELETPSLIDGDEITLDHLLEASAIATELLHLYSVHGQEAMERYYWKVVTKANGLYHLLARKFVALYDGDITFGASTLYWAVAISLYGSNTPVQRFTSLFSDLRTGQAKIQAVINAWLLDPFPAEEELKRAVLSEQLQDIESGDPIRVELEFAMEELAHLPRTLYEARRTLIELYVKQYGYRGNEYVEHLHVLPTPPILFYPLEAYNPATIAPAILEADLKNSLIDYYLIASHDDERGRVALAGLRAVPLTRPCIRFEVVDTILFANFCYGYLFEGREQCYSRGVDEQYLSILKKVVLDDSPPPEP